MSRDDRDANRDRNENTIAKKHDDEKKGVVD